MADILSNLHPPQGAVRTRTRRGRGVGSGLGKTAGKGQKGQKARHPGNFSKLAFQGGQTPMQRRLPKRGFNNPFPTEVATVNVEALSSHFEAGATVDLDSLKLAHLVKRGADRVKVLGDGELTHKLVLKVHAVSASARSKIEAAGGSIEIISTDVPSKGGSTAA
jgi:large subunit ribosomal protein L15